MRKPSGVLIVGEICSRVSLSRLGFLGIVGNANDGADRWSFTVHVNPPAL